MRIEDGDEAAGQSHMMVGRDKWITLREVGPLTPGSSVVWPIWMMGRKDGPGKCIKGLLSKLGENEKLDVGGESSICLGVRSMIRDAMIFRSKGGLALEFQGKCCGALHFVQLLRASSSPAVCEQNNRYNPDTEVED